MHTFEYIFFDTVTRINGIAVRLTKVKAYLNSATGINSYSSLQNKNGMFVLSVSCESIQDETVFRLMFP